MGDGAERDPHPEELARDQVTVAELVAADRDDLDTPEHFDWPQHPMTRQPPGVG